jgi:pyroglutamyl-peptidase
LLTGFGPFGNVVSNPTERLIQHFMTEQVPGHDLVCWSFPVSFQRAPEMMQALLEIGGRNGKPFDVLLMLGVAPGSKTWRVEKRGLNYNAEKIDRDGYTPDAGVILQDAPEILPATLPVEPLVTALERIGLPVIASESAGDYLCNYLFYTTLYALMERNASLPVGFLHVPADEVTFTPGVATAPRFTFEQHIAAVRAVLKAIAELPLPVSSGENLDLRSESLSA